MQHDDREQSTETVDAVTIPCSGPDSASSRRRSPDGMPSPGGANHLQQPVDLVQPIKLCVVSAEHPAHGSGHLDLTAGELTDDDQYQLSEYRVRGIVEQIPLHGVLPRAL